MLANKKDRNITGLHNENRSINGMCVIEVVLITYQIWSMVID